MPLGQTLAGLLPVAGTALGAGIGGMYTGGLGGPIGAQIGGGLGAVAQNLFSDYFKQPSQSDQAQGQLLQQLQQPAPYQRVDFNPIAQEEMRRFQQEVVPGIAERFGGMGGLSSSGFRQSLTGAGQDLQTRLAALRSQHELGQQGAMTGAEERRRQMLANLTGGISGNEQMQQMNRQNQMNQLAGQLPGTIMDTNRFQEDTQKNIFDQLFKQLTNQQESQNTAINQTGQVGNQAFLKNFQNLIRQDPTKAEKILRNVFDALKASAEVGGAFARGAVGAV